MAEKKYIEREVAKKKHCEICMESCICYRNKSACDELKAFDLIPAVDVQPVVLCKDCKHKGWVQEPEHGKSVDYCRLIERCVDKQFFCAAGERKTNCGADIREEI